MRYYKIVITNATTGEPILPSSLMGLPLSSLLPSGGPNTAALNVELDIPVTAMHVPGGNALIRIWGLGIKDIGGAFNLNPLIGGRPGALVSVFGGMSKGLPLANPAQARLLVKGQVLQAFGNWVGTTQTVDILLAAPSTGSSLNPVNYTLDWKTGSSLSDAIASTLKTALPDAKQDIRISPRLTLGHDQQGFYGSLPQLNSLLNPLSKSIITDAGYVGVSIAYDGQTVTVYDGTITSPTSTTIAFQDLIGQPTWINSQVIQIKCAMRGDIDLFDMVTLPPSLVTSTSAAVQGLSGNNPANNLAFSGPYTVTEIHHYGNFRQPDAMSWNTTINMIKAPSQSGTTP